MGSGGGLPTGAAAPPCRNPNLFFCFNFLFSSTLSSNSDSGFKIKKEKKRNDLRSKGLRNTTFGSRSALLAVVMLGSACSWFVLDLRLRGFLCGRSALYPFPL